MKFSSPFSMVEAPRCVWASSSSSSSISAAAAAPPGRSKGQFHSFIRSNCPFFEINPPTFENTQGAEASPAAQKPPRPSVERGPRAQTAFWRSPWKGEDGTPSPSHWILLCSGVRVSAQRSGSGLSEGLRREGAKSRCPPSGRDAHPGPIPQGKPLLLPPRPLSQRRSQGKKKSCNKSINGGGKSRRGEEKLK